MMCGAVCLITYEVADPEESDNSSGPRVDPLSQVWSVRPKGLTTSFFRLISDDFSICIRFFPYTAEQQNGTMMPPNRDLVRRMKQIQPQFSWRLPSVARTFRRSAVNTPGPILENHLLMT